MPKPRRPVLAPWAIVALLSLASIAHPSPAAAVAPADDAAGSPNAAGLSAPDPNPGDHASLDATWTELAPPARDGQSAVFDAKRNRLIVFGGRLTAERRRSEVWVLTLHGRPRWEQASPTGTPPSPREGAAAIYDAARDRMLVIGGRDSTGNLNDVYELSLRGHFAWRMLAPAGVPPDGRAYATATLDEARHRILLIGGSLGDYRESNEVWSLSLAGSPAWSRLNPAGMRPSSRAMHSAVDAPDLGGVLVFGGACSMCGDYPFTLGWSVHDTWLLMLDPPLRWVDKTPEISGAAPCGIFGHSAIYDRARRRMLVLAGDAYLGGDCTTRRPFLWSLSTEDWHWSPFADVADQPSGRVRASVVEIPDANRALVYGGAERADTWALDLEATPGWKRVLPTGSAPISTNAGSIRPLLDAKRDRWIVYTGAGVWTRDVESGEGWREIEISGAAPERRQGFVTALDPGRDRLVVFGGERASLPHSLLTDVWMLSLDRDPSWARILPRGDSPATYGAVAMVDPVRDRLLVIGGGFMMSDRLRLSSLPLDGDPLWSSIVSTGPGPRGLQDCSAIYDGRRDRLVIFGGGWRFPDSGWNSNVAWALPLDGAPVWERMGGAAWLWPAPAARSGAAAVYDEGHDRMVIIGGYVAGGWPWGSPPGDEWALDLAASRWEKISAGRTPSPLWYSPAAGLDADHDRIPVLERDMSWALDLERRRPGPEPLPGLRPLGPERDVALEPHGRLALRVLAPQFSAGRSVAEFSLRDATPARLVLIDIAGRRIWSRDLGGLGAGTHRVEIDADAALPSGIYFLCLTRGAESVTSKLLHLR